MKRIVSLLLGAVIAAAFLGPGTIAAAASAGAGYGLTLLWALLFATAACFVLQEACARLTIVSGRPLAAALRQRYRGAGGVFVLLVVLGAILVGCAAYEAGNILGGVAGAVLALDAGAGSSALVSPPLLTLVISALACLLLGSGRTRVVATALGLMVALMAVAFAFTAIGLAPSFGDLARGMLVPTVPDGGMLLVLGLIGTTVVPYNFFLGSGLAAGQTLRDARWGLAVAIIMGGLVSMAVVVVGSAVDGPFSFEALAAVLGERLGARSVEFFGWGLFAAGFTSAVTAPWAAALTARGLFASTEATSATTEDDSGDSGDSVTWGNRSWRFRAVWATVLLIGTAFGIADVKPIPVILIAQAMNGVLLPVLAMFLMIAANDRQLMDEARNGVVSNVAMGGVLVIATSLGVRGLSSAASKALNQPALASATSVLTLTALALVGLSVWWWRERSMSCRRAEAA